MKKSNHVMLDFERSFDSSSLSSFSGSFEAFEGTNIQVNGRRIDLTGATNCVIVDGFANVQISDGTAVFSGIPSNSTIVSSSKPRSASARSQRKPLSDSINPLSNGDLEFVCDNIGKKWKSLGRALGLSRGQLEQVELDFRPEGHYEMSWQMLLKWRRQKGDQARVCDLVRALDKIEMTKLARALPVP